MASDEGAARLDEVALVFGDVLLDENATCHVAWGAAYPFTVEDLPEGEAGQDAIGFNRPRMRIRQRIGLIRPPASAASGEWVLA